MRDIRGREISMIFQNPRAALNPIRKVGRQIEDVLLEHVKAAPSEVTEKASRSSIRSVSRGRASVITLIRSNCPAACASASSLRWRWPASRNC